jgi:hypothetical protein
MEKAASSSSNTLLLDLPTAVDLSSKIELSLDLKLLALSLKLKVLRELYDLCLLFSVEKWEDCWVDEEGNICFCCI